MKNIALPFASLLVLAISPRAIAALPAEPIRESEQRQVQIQGETRQLVGALDAMLGEYERNNLSGDDVATVRRLRQSLDSLTTSEMRQVVDLLQKARAGTDAGAAVKIAADAFTAQKQVIVSIQRILAEHSRVQEAAEIARQLNDLADRQTRNLQNGIELGRMTAGTKPESFEALYQAQLETQRGEQAAIAAELGMARGKLNRFAADPENADIATPFKTGAQQLQRIEPIAEAAAESLKAGQLFKAAADEKTSREELRKVARQIAPRDRGPEALRKAEQEVAQVIADQKELAANTGQQRTQPNFDKWIDEKIAANDTNNALPSKFRNQPASALRQNKELRERFDNEQREKAAQLAKLEDQQGELAAKTDALGQDVAQVPQAAAGLRQAMDKMQEARAAMQDANAAQAGKQQDDALARLQAAHADIKRRADEAELLAGNSGDKVKDLERLQKVAEELAQQEAAMATNPKPDAAAQADVARRANQLAQRAPAAAPKAAQPAQAAAANAKQAEQAMQAGNAAQGRADAQQAAQNLAEAAKQIAQQLAQAQAAQQQAADARAALAELAKIIEAEQALDFDTAKADALAAQKAPALFADIATRQGAVQNQSVAFKTTLDASMPAASLGIGEAGADMTVARAQLDAGSGAAAREAEQRAIAKLLAAQDALGAALEQAEAASGQPMNAGDGAQMAQAADALAKAEEQIQKAQSNLQQAAQQGGQQAAQSMQQASQQLAQAAQQTAKATSQNGAQMPPGAKQSAQQASQQLAGAAAQSASGHNANAQQSAQAASQSLAQAQAAMAAMQAGLSPSQGGVPMPGAQGQPGAPGKGSGKPGQGKGTGPSSQAGNQPSEGATGYKPGDPKAVERGARAATLGKTNFIGLPQRERDAIQQSLREKYPEEYGALVEQYFLNLANESAKK